MAVITERVATVVKVRDDAVKYYALGTFSEMRTTQLVEGQLQKEKKQMKRSHCTC